MENDIVETTIKNIQLPDTKPKKNQSLNLTTSYNSQSSFFKKNNYKEKEKRVVTQSSKWEFSASDFEIKNQFELLKNTVYSQRNDTEITTKGKCMMQEITKKLYGYKTQDMIKKIYDENKFVNVNYLLDLLIEKELKCFYCKEDVNVIYEPIREPKQWSLERIDNTYGHNVDNVTIACLSCNLRRRTMYHERYIFTKQLSVIKSDKNG